MKPTFVVLRAGLYTACINGAEITAEKTAVLGIYSDYVAAQRIADTTPVSAGWGACCTWVDSAVLDAEATHG